MTLNLGAPVAARATGVPDVSETTVAGENDLVALSMTLQGCSAWLLDHPATGLVTVAQTGAGETKVWRNATKTAAGENPGPNAMCNGSTLFLEGKTKSEALGDVQIGEQYGDVSQNNAYTVLRLDVFGDINHDDSVNKDDMTAARAQSVQGLIIGCGATNRVLVQLRTECALNSGTVTLSLDGGGAAGSVRLWESPTSYSGETPYLVSGQTTNWQGDAIRDLPEFKSLYVDATDGGSATLTYSYADDSQSVGFNSYLPITVLKVEFQTRAGKINNGFDPPESLVNDKPWPWASVAKNGTSDVCKLVIEPASMADQIDVVMTSGGCAIVTPTNFSSGSTDLLIVGQDSAGHAVAEAKIKGTSTTCATLNIRSQTIQSLSVGIYFIQDTNSPATMPIDGPSASEIIDTLNDIFQQGQISFTLEESYTTNIAYDANTNGLMERSERDAIDIASPSWKGDYRVLLIKNSGIYYDDPPYATNWLVRGQASISAKGAILFVQNLGTCVDVAVAHEVGHVLEIPIVQNGINDHDGGPWPFGEESLMRSGIEPSGPVNCPGRWLRHEDWKEANETTQTF